MRFGICVLFFSARAEAFPIRSPSYERTSYIVHSFSNDLSSKPPFCPKRKGTARWIILYKASCLGSKGESNRESDEFNEPETSNQHTPLSVESVPFQDERKEGEEQLEHFTSTSRTNDDRNKFREAENEKEEWLDRPFFQPENYVDNDEASPPLQWFAKLVQQDYNTAEALFASLFITFMVVITQEVLRFQLYGDTYVPFSRGGGGGGGNLF